MIVKVQVQWMVWFSVGSDVRQARSVAVRFQIRQLPRATIGASTIPVAVWLSMVDDVVYRRCRANVCCKLQVCARR